MNDEVLDEVARLWYLGKSLEPPAVPATYKEKIPVEGWRPGDLVVWDDAFGSLRGDTYVIGDRVSEAVELYCVQCDCTCGEVVVDFVPVVPRGAPHPGHVELDGGHGTLHPSREGQRPRVTELWETYCRRHGDYRDRLAARSAAMHGFAGRIVRAPSRTS